MCQGQPHPGPDRRLPSHLSYTPLAPRPRQPPSPPDDLLRRPLVALSRDPSIPAMSLADLNFSKGQAFEQEVWKKWGVRTNFREDQEQEEFLLVAEFTRSKIRLIEESVGTILLACFGGRASLFMVQQLQNWSFKFSVSSKEVGYSIIKGGNISIPEFNLNFLLWGNGGPNSSYELDLYLQEKEDAWTHIFRKQHRKSYAQAVSTPLTLSRSKFHSSSFKFKSL